MRKSAAAQIRYRDTPGRAYYDRKIAEGNAPKEALRALKRRVSDVFYSPAAPELGGLGGQPGTTLTPARPAHTPSTGSDECLPPAISAISQSA